MRPLSENRRAYFDYEILEKFEAGIVLRGQEVKSIKNGRISLAGSYVAPKNNELFLINADIPAWQPKNAPEDYDSKRSRKLLLKKSEIEYLIGKTKKTGLALIPLKIYAKSGRIKLEFGITKNKKKSDKRETIKKREFEREKARLLGE